MTDSDNEQRGTRRRALTILATTFGGIGLAWAAYHGLVGRHHVVSDNAYVAGHLVQITPQTAGTLIAVQVDDADRVEAGDVLARLDPADARLAFDQARAALAQAVRDVRAQFADAQMLQALVSQREAQLVSARAAAVQAQAEHARRERLGQAGVVSGEALSAAIRAHAAADAEVAAADSALAAAACARIAALSASPDTTPA